MNQDDLIVHGVEPIHLRRTYLSGKANESEGGWTFLPHLKLQMKKIEDSTEYELIVAEPDGTIITYNSENQTSKKVDYEFLPNSLKKTVGPADTVRDQISAKTNHLNNRIHLNLDEKVAILYAADGSIRVYGYSAPEKKEEDENEKNFYLKYIQKPNRNQIHYEYGESFRIERVKTTNHNGQKIYAWADFHYSGEWAKNHDFQVSTSTGHTASYSFWRNRRKKTKDHFWERKKDNPDSFYLKLVNSSQRPIEKYGYQAQHKAPDPQVTQKILADGMVVELDYYHVSHNKLADGSEVHIPDEDDTRYNRIKNLSFPYGENGEIGSFYTIKYTPGKRLADGTFDREGLTHAIDFQGHQVVYRCTPDLQMKQIEYHDKDYGMQKKRKFFWGKGPNKGRLLCRAYTNAKDENLLAQHFVYDAFGNIIKESIYGNLTGLCNSPLLLDEEGNPITDEIESFSKEYKYTEKFHLLECEREESGLSKHYVYHPGTDLLISKFVCDKGDVKIRYFYDYNEDGILVAKMVDNGTSFDAKDSEGVTERRFFRYFLKQEQPALGLPETILETYYDFALGQETLIRKKQLVYGENAKIIREDVYDNQDTMKYQLHTKYGENDLVLSRTTPLGHESCYEYDESYHQIYVSDAKSPMVYRYKYDGMNRLVSSIGQDSKGEEYETKYEYDQYDQRIATTDSRGFRINYASGSQNGIQVEYPPIKDEKNQVIHPETWHFFDCWSSPILRESLAGNSVYIEYNSYLQPTRITHSNGSELQKIYSPRGELLKVIDEKGSMTHFSYDFLGRMTEKKMYLPSGELFSQESWVYNAFHLVSHIDPSGCRTHYFYDGAGRKTQEVIFHGNEMRNIEYEYDSLGNCSATRFFLKDQPGFCLVERRVFDLERNVIEQWTESPKGDRSNHFAFSYDAYGNQVKVTRFTSLGSLVSLHEYDEKNRQTKTTDPEGHVTSFSYNDGYVNDLGQLVTEKTTIFPNGDVQVELYDVFDRMVALELKDSFSKVRKKEEYNYDLKGQKTRQMTYLFKEGLLVGEEETLWDYGPSGELIRLTELANSKSPKVTEYQYDIYSNLTEDVDPNRSCISSFYDPQTDLMTGLLSHQTYNAFKNAMKQALEPDKTINRIYDVFDRSTSIVFPDDEPIASIYDSSSLLEVVSEDRKGNVLYSHHFARFDDYDEAESLDLISKTGKVKISTDVLEEVIEIRSPYSYQGFKDVDPHKKVLMQNEILSGEDQTHLVDSQQTQVVYKNTPHLRMKQIEYYDKGDGLQKKRKFYWGKGKNDARLVCRAYATARDENLLAQHFVYDDFGNVIKESIYGNLSGLCTSPLLLNEEGEPTTKTECFSKEYKYTEKYHLLEYEGEDGGLCKHYVYYPGTNLLMAKFICDQDNLKIRFFYDYNEDGILILERVDDGTSFDIQSDEGVTERKFYRYALKQNHPAWGLPETIIESYYDLDLDREILIRKKRLMYGDDGKVIRENLYDDKDQLVVSNIKEPHNQKSEALCEYDQYNQRIATVDSRGRRTNYTYDSKGNCIKVEYPLTKNEQGRVVLPTTRFSFDCWSNPTKKESLNGSTTLIEYNSYHQPTRIIQPDGTELQKIYSSRGDLLQVIDEKGAKTLFEYDFLGRMTEKKVYSPSGNLFSQESWKYNAFHLLSYIGPSGCRTDYSYDGAGRRTQEVIVCGNEMRKTQYGYDSLGNCSLTRIFLDEQTGACLVQCRTFDVNGNIIEQWDENEKGDRSEHFSFVYDTRGNQTKIVRFTSLGSLTCSYEYDEKNRLTKIVDPEDRVTLLSYCDTHVNDLGQLVTEKLTLFPNGDKQVEVYDVFDRVVSLERTDSLSNVLKKEKYCYDLEGRKTCQVLYVFKEGTQVGAQETLWDYGPCGELVRLTEFANSSNPKVTEYRYDDYGNLAEVLKPNGICIRSSYDQLNRLYEVVSSDGSIHYRYSYNKAHQLSQVTNLFTGLFTYRSYDAFGNVIQEALESGKVMCRTYDALDRCTSVKFPNGESVAYIYDTTNLLEVARKDYRGTVLYSHQFREFDDYGTPTSQDLACHIGTVKTNTDRLGRVMEVRTPYSHYSIKEMDQHGYVTHLVNILSDSYYTYDAMHQLVLEKGLVSHKYDYDNQHNRILKDARAYKVDEFNQLLFAAKQEFFYDRNGNIIEQKDMPLHYEYRYDALGRLVFLKIRDIGEYHLGYDGFNRRVFSQFISYDETQVRNEDLGYLFVGDIEVGSFNEDGIKDLKILSMRDPKMPSAPVAIELGANVYVPLLDLQGNVTHLIDATSRKIAEMYHYTAFGEQVIFDGTQKRISQSSVANFWGYQSKRNEPRMGLIDFGKRFYSPDLGRWFTPDPAGFLDGTNLYQYVFNSPLYYLDQDGKSAVAFTTPLSDSPMKLGSLDSVPVGGAICGRYRVDLTNPINSMMKKASMTFMSIAERTVRAMVQNKGDLRPIDDNMWFKGSSELEMYQTSGKHTEDEYTSLQEVYR